MVVKNGNENNKITRGGTAENERLAGQTKSSSLHSEKAKRVDRLGILLSSEELFTIGILSGLYTANSFNKINRKFVNRKKQRRRAATKTSRNKNRNVNETK